MTRIRPARGGKSSAIENGSERALEETFEFAKVVASGVNRLKGANNAQLVITHYQRLLNYIIPDFVHVLFDGRIMRSGGKELAFELEERGYDWVMNEAAVPA